MLKVMQHHFCIIVLVVTVSAWFLFKEHFTVDDAAAVVSRSLPLLQAQPKENIRKPKILCFVLTYPKNHYVKAIHVKNTWGQRCDKLLFMSTQEDPKLGAVKLPISAREGRRLLWAKTKASLEHIWMHYCDEGYDWFMKADDDTFVVVENLRTLLQNYSTNEPLYLGYQMTTPPDPPHKLYVQQGFNYGGCGYVLSREALSRFIHRNQLIGNQTRCSVIQHACEDWMMGICMEELGVRAVDTRDKEKRHRFLPLELKLHLNFGNPFDRFKTISWYSSHPMGKNCCSPSVVSFHYVPPEMMYVYEYLIYSVNPHSRSP